ncbi:MULTISPECIES: glycosyltransferase family 4 protein [Nostocales]|uniref:Glycosyltransferase family 4 protein n=3 Tax=Nostocales TaxID=1161 RepID=A0A8S9SZG8_9CYAN|nr:glycosyltransferase family 1 protein [Tolypothrix bouteillei]KAF3885781.1 glycosyltransferase family 4 protein [Tolypothrix bouteillei VB521301]
MKILYDISLLGIGHYDPVNRTGTFRVVENMACGLASLKDINLKFCVSQNLPVLVECLDYLTYNKKLLKKTLAYSKPQEFIARQLYNYNIKLSKSHDTLPLKVLKKFYRIANRLAEKHIHPLNAKLLQNADVFHSPCFALTSQVKESKNVKKFLTVHDLIPILYPNLFEHNNEEYLKKILNSIDSEDYVTCVSNSTKNDLCNYLKNIDPERVFVTHLAAAPDVFYPCSNSEKLVGIRNKYHIPNAAYILSLCTLEPRKNIDHVIRCFAKLIQEQNIKDLYLILVGTKGWSYNKIFEEVANFPLAKERVILTGYVADEDLAALYSGALAFTYLSFYEGFGLPPLEAMQCGVPVISSNTSSLPEVVGDAAIMLDPLDVDGLCQSILEIYNNSSLRETMSLKSIEQAKRFSWERCARETVKAYKKAVAV